ncbi:hypothetical protein BJY21_000517 [Kineosphaera limosa]|uniref:Uncharacterized protein n=1 Tax=Kineosphaera limosa NBRC 100340 TaxID=1184609 RepID=K6WLM7_9MICO|nr:hypothetical protein [Kineosphaera limosa]NYD99332.1 hypothetical protein [Kineosphaera limosa]GAB94711.1 hypothetical protein KILIM_010_00420 [Kineosphaera limosa NBRC 100340]
MSSPMLSAPISQALRGRTESTARRLLAGAGRASFTAYRHDAQRAVDVPAHGLTSTGELVVAHRGAALPCEPTAPTQVRLDIRREATEARVRIVAATAHALGSIEWLSAQALDRAVAEGRLPPTVALVAQAPDALVGVVTCDRVLVHDAAGVTPLAFADLARVRRGRPALAPFPSADQEFEVAELAAALPESDVYELYAGVSSGRLAGSVLSQTPIAPSCRATLGRIYWVDIDGVGVTLMHVGAGATTVVFAPFAQPARDLAQLSARLTGLLHRARS